MALAQAIGVAPSGDCDHDDTEELGWGGSALYLRCTSCGAALIRQAERTWMLRPRAASS